MHTSRLVITLFFVAVGSLQANSGTTQKNQRKLYRNNIQVKGAVVRGKHGHKNELNAITKPGYSCDEWLEYLKDDTSISGIPNTKAQPKNNKSRNYKQKKQNSYFSRRTQW